jgi:hypothetical protein
MGTPLAPGKPLLLSPIVQSLTSKAPVKSCRGFYMSSIRWNRLRTSCNFYWKGWQSGHGGETISIAMTWFCASHRYGQKQELVMNGRITDTSEGIDRKTSRSICDAVGERLQQDLRPESLRPSSHLQHLMDELRKRDHEDRPRSSH